MDTPLTRRRHAGQRRPRPSARRLGGALHRGSKSDRLPERKLLLARRDAVIGCWEVARDKRPLLFKREAEGLAGSEEPGLGVLFEAMVEAVEVTAMQRGAERWAG